MARKPLNRDQLLAAESALLEAFRAIQHIRERHGDAGSLIQLPKTPPLIAESIVYWKLLSLPEVKSLHFREGGRDMIAEGEGKGKLAIEVKSTGGMAFQHLSQKDISSDWLVWVHFDHYFEGGDETIVGHFLQDIGTEFDAPGRVTLNRMLNKIPSDNHQVLFKGSSIQEILDRIEIPQKNLSSFLG